MTDLIGPVARVGSGGGAGEVTVGQVLRAPLLGGGRELSARVSRYPFSHEGGINPIWGSEGFNSFEQS